MYNVILNEQSYDLPKLTLKLQKEIDKVNKMNANTNIDLEKRIKANFDFIKSILKKDEVLEIFETEDLNEVDTVLVTTSYLKICQAYDKPIKEVKDNINYEQIDKLNEFKDLLELCKNIK